MFIDQVKIQVEAGVGGSGAEAFRRESGVPRGGPSGGDGGHGGSVILEADPQLSTLSDFRYAAQYRAERGQHGEGSNRTGRSGEDLVLRVPPGTVIKDLDSGEILGELVEEGSRMVIAQGGRGGRGNARFATSTRQAPRRWEVGEEGESRHIELTLKLLADVGLVGEPNAGKSTLLATVSAARPRIADYPFTTLTPNLGVAQLSGYRSCVIADIPGIIEGAHEGRGLGDRFLRHIERTRALALLIPLDDPDPQGTYDGLREELSRYNSELATRPHCLVFSKADLIPADEASPEVEAPEAWARYRISAVSREGLEEFLEGVWRRSRPGSGDGEGAGSAKDPEESAGAGAESAGAEGEEDWWDRADRDL
ncbi:MAG: GTPase ObgE [Gemmatimonadota bacterium]